MLNKQLKAHFKVTAPDAIFEVIGDVVAAEWDHEAKQWVLLVHCPEHDELHNVFEHSVISAW